MSPQVLAHPQGYHHGDLRAALIDAALEIAREGGPAGLRLREVTRRAGVTPNAAYRHFDDLQALVVAAALVAQDGLADSMRREIADADSTPDPAARALARLRGVGLGYIDFALAEPGWFELALVTFDPHRGAGPSVTVDNRVPPPFLMLMDALDDMVEAGLLAPEQRVGAEWPCWSAVHGFSDIAARGPLQDQDRQVLRQLAERVVDAAIAGIRAPG